jgi:hypothetical protein
MLIVLVLLSPFNKKRILSQNTELTLQTLPTKTVFQTFSLKIPNPDLKSNLCQHECSAGSKGVEAAEPLPKSK